MGVAKHYQTGLYPAMFCSAFFGRGSAGLPATLTYLVGGSPFYLRVINLDQIILAYPKLTSSLAQKSKWLTKYFVIFLELNSDCLRF